MKSKKIANHIKGLDIEGKCVYCGGIIYCDGKKPCELWYPTNRLKQILGKGKVHRGCFSHALPYFNGQMGEEGQILNWKLLTGGK